MLKKLITINLKWVEAAFYTGAALGIVVGSFAGATVGVLIGAGLAFLDHENEEEDEEDGSAGEDMTNGGEDSESGVSTVQLSTRSRGAKSSRKPESTN